MCPGPRGLLNQSWPIYPPVIKQDLLAYPPFIDDVPIKTFIYSWFSRKHLHSWWDFFSGPPCLMTPLRLYPAAQQKILSVWLQCKVSRYGDVRDVVGDLRLSELENLGMLLASRLRTTIWCKYHQFPKHSRTTFNWLLVCSCLFMFFLQGHAWSFPAFDCWTWDVQLISATKNSCLVVSKHQWTVVNWGWSSCHSLETTLGMPLTVCELENHHQNNR